jgi:hypothetical protein
MNASGPTCIHAIIQGQNNDDHTRRHPRTVPRPVRRRPRRARMIGEVVEEYAPPGSVPSEEMVETPFVREAEVLVKGILAIAARTNPSSCKR